MISLCFYFSARQAQAEGTMRIIGLRLEDDSSESNDGIPSVLSNKKQTIRVFGIGLNNNTVISFTNEEHDYRGPCLIPTTDIFNPDKVSDDGFTATYTIQFPYSKKVLYLCAKNDDGNRVSKNILLCIPKLF